ncbi:ABC transporter-associated protein EcsC [Bacillus sp. FJAT-27225]|uniref:EcsC family protein n=1 Tax=Bacillus sp. FJAT-27225 TaxID=1743144 RepID=UPI00080C33D6|nr:EcsC family protein [Bacillus sp. FJAT-27225]OCA84342.1 ABC transporter-associated protein EcsC [Bacillus sp. FJAT-27225]
MNAYEQKVHREVQEWKWKLSSRSGLLNRLSKKAQTKMNRMIPEKVHSALTEAIKGMVKATLAGSGFTTKKPAYPRPSLQAMDEEAEKRLNVYQKTAMIEGAGTGAGGLLLGLADFPLLLTIKMKFLFELASVYGFDTDEYEERLFILHVFLLAFSSDETRFETLDIIDKWQETKKSVADMDWREFQQEYRDYIDLAKMLQLVPGIGAVVGAVANNKLLGHLGATAMNAYRLRLMNERQTEI